MDAVDEIELRVLELCGDAETAAAAGNLIRDALAHGILTEDDVKDLTVQYECVTFHYGEHDVTGV